MNSIKRILSSEPNKEYRYSDLPADLRDGVDKSVKKLYDDKIAKLKNEYDNTKDNKRKKILEKLLNLRWIN